MLGRASRVSGTVVASCVPTVLTAPLAASLLPSLAYGVVRAVHSSSSSEQQGRVAKAAPPKPIAPATAAPLKPTKADERVYDYKPILPRHQAIYKPVATASSWNIESVRTGVLVLKAGMTGDYDNWGQRRALTALALEAPMVTAVIEEKVRGYSAIQIGAGIPKLKHVNKPMAGFFAKQSQSSPLSTPTEPAVTPRAHLAEFRVTPDAFLPVGTVIDVRHFVPGQYVNVTGVSQGKGFQGAMKRHGFGGGKASHGNSVSHRSLGATGCRQDPGKVQKGKKMAGRLGGDTVTVQCLRVHKIDVKRNLVYVEGAVPGKAGTYLRLVDAPKKPFKAPQAPPFPTYAPTAADKALAAKWSAAAFLDPATEATLEAEGKLPEGYAREPAYELVVAPSAVDPFSIPEHDEAEEV
jgi:large subunit ribosomal protein L3